MKYFKLSAFFLVLLLIAGLNSCTKTLENNKKDYKETDRENINALLTLIDKINSNYPESFYSNFNVEGQSAGQKFKASGNVQFSYNPRKMRIVFHDAVFKTPITEVVQDYDVIKFYYPIEKKLFIDNINKIDLKFYSNYNINFKFLYGILTYKIPLIENFSVKKGLESEHRKSGAIRLIILENDFFYETLSFANDIPDKILWLNKITKEKIEVHLNDPFIIKGVLSYKNIRIISPDSDMKIDIQFNSKKINIPVDLEKIVKIKLPRDGKIINKN